MVLLQNCMGFVEDETGCCIEKCEMCDVDGTDEVSIKVEEAVDIKNEIPEAILVPPIKTEQEVRLWGVCVRCWQLISLVHLLPEKGNCEITLNYFVLCVKMWVPYSF